MYNGREAGPTANTWKESWIGQQHRDKSMKLSSPVVSAIVVATALQLSGYAAPAARAQNADPRPAPYYDLHKSYIYEPWQNHFHGTGVG